MPRTALADGAARTLPPPPPERLARGAVLRLAAVAVAYALYAAVYFTLGAAAFAKGRFVAHELVAVALVALATGRALRHATGPLLSFLAIALAGYPLLAIADASYGRTMPLWNDPAGQALQLTDAAYAGWLVTWVVGWGLLALRLAQRHRPDGRSAAVFALLMLGFVALFAGFYAPLYHGQLDTMAGRAGVLTAALELLAIVAGLAVMLQGAGHALVLQVFGLTLLAASDMLYAEATIRQHDFAAADPAWMLGLCLLLAGALVLPAGAHRHGGGPLPVAASRRSGLSTLLLALSLGAVLLSAIVTQLLRNRSAGPAGALPLVGEPFFYVLFVVALVVLMVWLTDRFDRAVQWAAHHAVQLVEGRAPPADWRSGRARLAWILDATGLGALLDALGAAAARLRENVIFLGPERLNPPVPATAAAGPPSCFLVMPFGQRDSDAVHRLLREACHEAGLRPLRGDDLYTPTDILDDIWRGITAARCVIADISGRNPNVMYELGIAHTLAKPVLILSRHAADIPIDLATRRVIVYGEGDEGDWQERLAAQLRAALGSLLADYPAAQHAQPVAPAQAARAHRD